MKRKVNPLYYFVPVAHVLIIGLLVFFQWKPDFENHLASTDDPSRKEVVSGETVDPDVKVIPPKEVVVSEDSNEQEKETTRWRRAKFSKKIGELEVSSKKRVRVSKLAAKVSTAIVEYGDFIFEFEDKKDLVWIDEVGKEHFLDLKEAEFDKKTLTMILSKDVKVLFSNDTDKSVTISAIGKEAGFLMVRMSASEKSALEGQPGAPFLVARGKKKDSVLLQSSGKSSFQGLILPVSGGSTFVPMARVVEVSGKNILESVCNRYKGDKVFADSFNLFRQRAYTGWLKGRYNSQSGLWMMENGEEGVSSDLVSAFMTESYLRNEPKRALAMVGKDHLFSYNLVAGSKYENLRINPEMESLQTALLFGNLRKNYNSHGEFADSTLVNFRRAVAGNDFSVLLNENLIEEVLIWGTPEDRGRLIAFLGASLKLASVEFLAPTLIQGVRMIDLMSVAEGRSFSQMVKDGVVRLAQNIAFGNTGAWLAVEGKALVLETFYAAFAFDQTKSIVGTGEYNVLAGLLMKTALSTMDSNGFFPVIVNFSTAIPIGSEKIAPEVLFSWIGDRRFTPRIQRVESKVAGTFYVYHRAKNLKLVEKEGEVALEFEHWHEAGSANYPVAVLNSFFVTSVRPFSQISMWTSDSWPRDASFEAWRIGYYYWESDQLIAAMLRHRSNFETFSLVWE